MSRETLCCVFQVFSFKTNPLFWVCQKAKIWSPCMVEPLLIYIYQVLILEYSVIETFDLDEEETTFQSLC